jgi:hypothetical protein
MKCKMALFDQVDCARKGRGALARQLIATGTRILQTSASASISASCCNWCFSTPQTQKLHKCGGCHRVKYCSRKCQQLDWTRGLHTKECAAWKHVPKHVQGKSMQTVLLVTRMAAKLFLSDQEQTTDGQSVLQLCHHYGNKSLYMHNARNPWCNDEYDIVYVLQMQMTMERVNCSSTMI